MGCVYKLTNLITGKCYVGMTTLTVQRRWKAHVWDSKRPSRCLITRAIGKYGSIAFKIEILAVSTSRRRLFELERYFIKALDTKHPNGYNLTFGGEGVVAERTPEWCARISAARKGAIFSDEHIENLRRSHAGKSPAWSWTPERRAKASQSAKLRATDPEERKRRSERAKQQHAEGRLGRRVLNEEGRPRANYIPHEYL